MREWDELKARISDLLRRSAVEDAESLLTDLEAYGARIVDAVPIPTEGDWYQYLDKKFARQVLWQRDMSADYETNEVALIQLQDGRFAYVSAQGCSCWSGEASLSIIGDLFEALGPHGVPTDVRDEDFHTLCRRWGVEPTT